MSQSTNPDTDTDTADSLQVIIKKERFQQALDQLDTIVNEAIFRLGRDGLEVTVVDPANVAMADIHLEESAFESVGDGKFPIGINIETLTDYLKYADSEDLVQLTYIPETGMLELRYGNTSVEIAAIDPESIRNEPQIPDVEWRAYAALDGQDFVDAIKQGNVASDHIHFTADTDQGTLEVHAQGDTDTVSVEFDRDDLLDGRFEESAESMYSIDYLTGEYGLLTQLPSDTRLEVEYTTEYPAKFEYDFADGNGHAIMTLAPRIQAR